MKQELHCEPEVNTKIIHGSHGPVQMDFTTYTQQILIRAKKLQQQFINDESFKDLFEKLLLYFWEDEQFEILGYGSLNKGICIAGNTGVGKTYLLELFKFNPRRNFTIVGCNSVANSYQSGGLEALDISYGQTKKRRGMNCDERIYPSICFDDLGAERIPINYMGSQMNVMQEIIIDRYQNKCYPYLTHFTTNLSGDQIEELYGERVRSRLREMVNFFELKGKDRRK